MIYDNMLTAAVCAQCTQKKKPNPKTKPKTAQKIKYLKY